MVANFKTYEAQARLLCAVIAAHPELKLDYNKIAIFFGESSAGGLNWQFRTINKAAKDARKALANGNTNPGQIIRKGYSEKREGSGPVSTKQRTARADDGDDEPSTPHGHGNGKVPYATPSSSVHGKRKLPHDLGLGDPSSPSPANAGPKKRGRPKKDDDDDDVTALDAEDEHLLSGMPPRRTVRAAKTAAKQNMVAQADGAELDEDAYNYPSFDGNNSEGHDQSGDGLANDMAVIKTEDVLYHEAQVNHQQQDQQAADVRILYGHFSGAPGPMDAKYAEENPKKQEHALMHRKLVAGEGRSFDKWVLGGNGRLDDHRNSLHKLLDQSGYYGHRFLPNLSQLNQAQVEEAVAGLGPPHTTACCDQGRNNTPAATMANAKNVQPYPEARTFTKDGRRDYVFSNGPGGIISHRDFEPSAPASPGHHVTSMFGGPSSITGEGHYHEDEDAGVV